MLESVHGPPMSELDVIALFVFVALWLGFTWLTSDARNFGRISLNAAVAKHRSNWIHNSLKRDLKMIDTQIMTGLQNGTGFFASTSLLALGGCLSLFSVLSQKEAAISDDLSFVFAGGRAAVELKLAGLTLVFGYSFFKFGWAYRLFNYSSILFGGLPMLAEAAKDPEAANRAADQVVAVNVIAARHFNAGLRAIFLSIGYLGWFINPIVFMAATMFVIVILVRRQFYSHARDALTGDFRSMN